MWGGRWPAFYVNGGSGGSYLGGEEVNQMTHQQASWLAAAGAVAT